MLPPGGEFCARLCADGLAIQDDALAPATLRALRDCARLRGARQEFKAAGVGAGARQAAGIRGDSICWLAEPLLPAERALLGAFETLRLDCNRVGLLGLFDLELHYACYPAGAVYARHVDQLAGSTHRQVSVVLYLNDAWPAEGGGELRLWAAGGPRDIAPVGGRLVCFLSEGREHEVLPARRERLSLTGWFRRR